MTIFITFLAAGIGIIATFAFQHWFENFARSNNAQEREDLSKKWHAAQWMILTLFAVIPILAFDFYFLFVYLGIAMILWWWGFDAYKGLKYGMGILYAGNGKGSSLEIIINWIAKKLNTRFKWFYLMCKVWATMLYAAFLLWWFLYR